MCTFKGVAPIAIRLLRNDIPTLEELLLPPIMADFAMRPRGLVLVTGPTGSGKSTTAAAMIDYINVNRSSHIITIEDLLSMFTSINAAWSIRER